MAYTLGLNLLEHVKGKRFACIFTILNAKQFDSLWGLKEIWLNIRKKERNGPLSDIQFIASGVCNYLDPHEARDLVEICS